MKLFDMHEADTSEYCDDDAPAWTLAGLKEAFPRHTMLVEDDEFYVFHKNFIDPEATWEDMAFFEHMGSSKDETRMSLLCTVSGTTGCLRECRHTNFADGGYVFYMNQRNMRAMLDYLGQFFE